MKRAYANKIVRDVFNKVAEPARAAGWSGTIANTTLVFIRENERAVFDLDENVAYFYYNDANYFKLYLNEVMRELDTTLDEAIVKALRAL